MAKPSSHSEMKTTFSAKAFWKRVFQERKYLYCHTHWHGNKVKNTVLSFVRRDQHQPTVWSTDRWGEIAGDITIDL